LIRKVLLTSSVALVVAFGLPAGASAQVPAGCSVPVYGGPVVCPPPPACNALAAKLSLARATFNRIDRTISIFAPLTRLASGNVQITLRAAGRTTSFTAPVDSSNGWVRVVRGITAAQARLGTGILTINYPGDADTRPQSVRLRAANGQAALTSSRPVITPTGFLRANGTVSSRARGVVRVQVQYTNRATGESFTLQRLATISNGRWNLNVELPPAVLAVIAARCGTVHSYVLFTGYMPQRIRGEMRSYQVMPAP